MACTNSNNRVKEIVRDNNFGYILGGAAIGIGALVAAVSPLSGDPEKVLNFAVVVAVLGAVIFIVSSIWNTLSLRSALAEQEAAANLKDAVTDFRADIESVYDALGNQKQALNQEDEALQRHIDEQARNIWDEISRLHDRINHNCDRITHIENTIESKSKSK